MREILGDLFSDFDEVFSELDQVGRELFDYRCNCNSLKANVKEEDKEANVKEEDKAYIVRVAVPGLTKDQIKIKYDKSYLTITAEWKKGCCSCCDEEGKYYRTIYVPEIDSTSIVASLKDGVLTLTIPKKESQNATININVE